MLKVAVTGGIGSGKSAVTAILAQKGCAVIDLDRVARSVLAPHSSATREVGKLWPEVVTDGVVDRERLASIVFDDAEALNALGSLTHPRTWALVDKELADRERTHLVGVVELALLYGSTREWAYHLNVVVDADEKVRIDRLVEARGMSEADARARISRQEDPQAVRGLAEVVIDNSGSFTQLETAVDALWNSRILPFAQALKSGHVSSDKPAANGPQIARAQKRLKYHGIATSDGPIRSALYCQDATAEQLTGAGFVRMDGYPANTFVSADPAYSVFVIRDATVSLKNGQVAL